MSNITHQEKNRGVATLDSIIRSALFDIDAGLERYEKFKHWAIEAYRDFHFDIDYAVKTVQCNLTAWKAVDLDLYPDYIDWAVIGLRINGEIRAFSNNNNLSLYFDDEDVDGFPDIQPTNDDYVYDPTDQSYRSGYWIGDINNWGEDTGRMFGLAVKDNGVGYFRINKSRNEIQFNPRIAASTKIYLEYLADGFDPGEQTVVNKYAAKAIKWYIHWQRLEFNTSSTEARVARARKNYFDELEKVRDRIAPITIEDILEIQRDSYRLTPSN